MTDAGNAASKKIIDGKISDDEWEEMIDYLLDDLGDPAYRDMDSDVLDALDRRAVAILILRHLLKDADQKLLDVPSMLARKWRFNQQSKKRPRADRDPRFAARAAEERELRTRGAHETGCTRPVGTITGALTMQATTADPSMRPYQVDITTSAYSNLMHTAAGKLPVAELAYNDQRMYARVSGYHDAETGIRMRDPPSDVVMVNYCMSAPPITLVELRFYGTQEQFDSEHVVPKHYTDVITQMPMVSRGTTFTSPEDASGFMIRVQRLESNGDAVFVGEMPYQVDRDITFIFTTESVRIGCAVCGHESIARCAGCVATPYCSPACQRGDWQHGGHEAICGGVKRGRGGNGGSAHRPTAKAVRPASARAGHRGVNARLRAMTTNLDFLYNWVKESTPFEIRQKVYGQTVGFYAALNDNNHFWYFVYARWIRNTELPVRNLLVHYQSYTLYRELVMTG